MARYRFVSDASTGEESVDEIIGSELTALIARETDAVRDQRAEEAADTQAKASRTQWRQMVKALGAYATPSRDQVLGYLTKTIEHEQRANTQWTTTVIVDAVKSTMRIVLWLAGRELRRLADGREQD